MCVLGGGVYVILYINIFLNVDLTRCNLDVDERRYLVGRGVVMEIQSNMGEYRVHSHIYVTVAFQYTSTCIKSILSSHPGA